MLDTPLTLATTAVLEPQGAAVQARWGYDPADPYAVSLSLYVQRRWVVWYLARNLLAAGLRARAGHGDVRIEPFLDDGLLIELSSPDGHALLHLMVATAERLLVDSYQHVPLGAERHHTDWDLDIELLRIQEDTP